MRAVTRDNDGNVLSSTLAPPGGSANPPGVQFAYDAIDRVTSKTQLGTATPATTSYGYDFTGRLLSAALTGQAAANSLSFRYDTAGRQIVQTDEAGNSITHTLDAAGRIIQLGLPGGYALTYSYDGFSRINTIASGSTTLATYGWDNWSRPASNRHGGIQTSPSYQGLTSWQWSPTGDLTSLHQTEPNGSTTLAFSASYNGAHQRTSETIGTPSFAFTPAKGSLSYGAADPDSAYPTVGAATLRYDGQHNTVFDGANTLTYDVENRLVAATNAQGSTATYLYDPLGNRKAATRNGVTTHYLSDGGVEIADYVTLAQGMTAYARGAAGDVVASLALTPANPAGDPTYYYTDQHGSTIATVHAGALTGQYSYGPYGETSTVAGAPFRYAGMRLDAETGLYYDHARYYSPALGRFLQLDPIGYAGGNNLYAYTGGDPVNLSDPSGLYARNDPSTQAHGKPQGMQLACAEDLCIGEATLLMLLYGVLIGTTHHSVDPAIPPPPPPFVSGDGSPTGGTGDPCQVSPDACPGSDGGSYAANPANGEKLKAQLAGEEIAGGHAFDKHVLDQGEYVGLDIRTREQFANLIEDVINNPTASRQLTGGRTAYWQDSTGTVVIRNPRSPDGGTAFRPTSGRTYFEGLR